VQQLGRVRLGNLLDWRWILPPPDTTLRRQVEQAFRDRGLDLPESSIESVSFLTNRELLRSSDLIGMFPNHIADSDIAAGTIARVDTEMPVPASPIGVSHLGVASLSPAAAGFLQTLRIEGARLAALERDGPRPGEGKGQIEPA
jgi:DNA-binding transcriptional LysR family regulator